MTRAELIEQRARDLIAAIDGNLDTKPWPVKYGVPFGEAVRLREALNMEKGTPMNVNKAIVVGFLGTDPAVRVGQTGDRIASFRVATSETWTDKTGERKKQTSWHNIVVFNAGLVEVVEKYLRKGSRVYLEGQMKTRSFKGADKVERSITEVVLGTFGSQLVLVDKRPDTAPPAGSEEEYGETTSTDASIEDDIPF